MTEEQLTEQFQLVDDIFNEALASNNKEEISKYISHDRVLIESQHGIINKERFLHVIEKGELSHIAMVKKVLRVKLHNDIALVTSRGMNIGFFKGEPFNSEYWVTNIYQKQNGNWVCIMTNETAVTCS